MAAPPTIPADAERQLPLAAETFLDHVGHFIPDADAASAALTRAGFAPAPNSIQVADGQLTGTGNVTAMLERGYIEVLFKTADTPLGREFDASMARYAGLHLIAFAVADVAISREQGDGALRGIIASTLSLPPNNTTLVTIRVGEREVHARTSGDENGLVSNQVWLDFKQYHVFDKESGMRLRSCPEIL